jgi:hypothetical protein
MKETFSSRTKVTLTASCNSNNLTVVPSPAPRHSNARADTTHIRFSIEETTPVSTPAPLSLAPFLRAPPPMPPRIVSRARAASSTRGANQPDLVRSSGRRIDGMPRRDGSRGAATPSSSRSRIRPPRLPPPPSQDALLEG